MCLIAGALHASEEYPVILALNRDEMLDRPSTTAAPWSDAPTIFAGRDLVRRGTWAGVTTTGRIAAVTNFRTIVPQAANRDSRGSLVRDFLEGETAPSVYIEAVAARRANYRHFNLIVGERDNLQALSSKTGEFGQIAPGFFGLSNGVFDEPWPKVEFVKRRLQEIIVETNGRALCELQSALIEMMSDRTVPADHLLPDTGVGIEYERAYGSAFIDIEQERYGTICTTIITLSADGTLSFLEHTHARDGKESFQSEATFSL